MALRDDHIVSLIYRSLRDQLLAHEQVELDDWLSGSAKRRIWYEHLQGEEEISWALSAKSPEQIDIIENAIYTKIITRAGIDNPTMVGAIRPEHRIHFLKTAWFRYPTSLKLRWASVAAIILLIGTVAYFWNNNTKKEPAYTKASVGKKDIMPGGNKAMLTLADGRTIVLDSAGRGQLTQQGNATIIKDADGQIRYRTNGNSDEVVLMNTMSTPKGGQYQLTLPDGTKVWLNAASTITYPTSFISNTREVAITGEAYFEVKKDRSKPFMVNTSRGAITVLGTSFNVNDYPDERNMKTSLLEGSIKIGTIVLKPGQAYQDGKIRMTNLDQDLAWKNGFFNFTDDSLRTVLRQLARWYDIEVHYVGNGSNELFNGELSRKLPLLEILKILKEVNVKFTIEGKTLIIH